VAGLSTPGRPGDSNSTDTGDKVGAPVLDMELLEAALPRLIKTWNYWTSGPKNVHVTLMLPSQGATAGGGGGGGGNVGTTRSNAMSRYWADWEAPRPESYMCVHCNACGACAMHQRGRSQSGWGLGYILSHT
jgi:hypothetical protein